MPGSSLARPSPRRCTSCRWAPLGTHMIHFSPPHLVPSKPSAATGTERQLCMAQATANLLQDSMLHAADRVCTWRCLAVWHDCALLLAQGMLEFLAADPFYENKLWEFMYWCPDRLPVLQNLLHGIMIRRTNDEVGEPLLFLLMLTLPTFACLTA